MEQVIIGVDPHKLSATIEVVDEHEKLLGSGRFTTDRAGYAAMRTYAKAWPDRVWAVEGANGVGRPLAQRLLEAGEQVVDVPAKLAARVRLFDTGHNRKTDALDAHSIAIVAVRTTHPAGAAGRRRARGAADAHRPTRSADPAPGPDRRPAPGAAGRTPSRAGQTRHHHRPGQGDARHASVLVTSPGRPAAASPPRSWPSWSRSRPRSRRPPPSSRPWSWPAARD